MACSRIARGGVALGSVLAVWSAGARADFAVNMTPGVTAISREVYDLHMLIFWICVAIGAVVFGVMFWSIYHHRKSRGAVAAQFHESALVEVLWTIVPMLILVAMAVLLLVLLTYFVASSEFFKQEKKEPQHSIPLTSVTPEATPPATARDDGRQERSERGWGQNS